MAGTVDPVVTTMISTMIDRIMTEMQLINQHLDRHEARITSIAAKLGLPPFAKAKMRSLSPSTVDVEIPTPSTHTSAPLVSSLAQQLAPG
jgi:hypothetical protein